MVIPLARQRFQIKRVFTQQGLAEFLPEHLGVPFSSRPAQVGFALQHLLHAVKWRELPGGNVLQKDQDQHVLLLVKEAKAGKEVVIAFSSVFSQCSRHIND